MFCSSCKLLETDHNRGIFNKRQSDPVIRAHYKAQLAVWKLLNPRTRAADLFFAKNDHSDVSVEKWLLETKDAAIAAIQELNGVTRMEVEYTLHSTRIPGLSAWTTPGHNPAAFAFLAACDAYR
jgi:hypothetical protein